MEVPLVISAGLVIPVVGALVTVIGILYRDNRNLRSEVQKVLRESADREREQTAAWRDAWREAMGND